MKNRISGALTAAALVALCTSTGARAQEKPVVATITVPVTVTNLDAEWAKRSLTPLSVVCELYKEAAPPATPGGDRHIAKGEEPIALVETPATATVRALFNFSGPVTVQTYATVLPASVGGGSADRGDPESQAQKAAAAAIKDAKSYACYFGSGGATPGKRSATGAGADAYTRIMEALTRGSTDGTSHDVKAENSSTYLVTGTFAPKK